MSSKKPACDRVRLLAWEVLKAIEDDQAYANLLLPPRITRARLNKLDAAFATELTYGTLRRQLFYDWIIAQAANRPVEKLDQPIRLALRLGLHQVFNMRVAEHAAVNETVDLVQVTANPGSAKLANAVMRQILRQGTESYLRKAQAISDPYERLSLTTSHPQWIISAYEQALITGQQYGARVESDLSALTQLLEANNQAPAINLVARPGLVSKQELFEQVKWRGQQAVDADLSPWGLIVDGGDPGRLPAIQDRLAAVEDQGSQLVAGLTAYHPVTGKDQRWLDLCAGPGGKTGLMAAIAQQRQARLVATEISEHRADLVRDSVSALPNVEVFCADGRVYAPEKPELFDRVLVDAPCTGLGALRRHPESRYRQRYQVVSDLVRLQRELLHHALDLTRPGGIVVYATCSPHRSETVGVLESCLRRRKDFGVESPRATIAKLVNPKRWPSGLGISDHFLQLWPHVHHSDAMFAAVLRKKA